MTVIAFDPGYGNIKLYGPAGGLVLPAAVAAVAGQGNLASMAGLKSAHRPMVVATDQGRFVVGQGAHDWGRPVEALDFDRLAGAPEIRALFYGALAQAERETGQQGISNPMVMVGLPIASLMGDQANGVKRGVSSWLKGQHTWQTEYKRKTQAHSLTVAGVGVTSQPVGALFDWLLDDRGQWVPGRRDLFKREIGVLGIGFNTVDLLVVRGGRPIQRFVAGQNVGVRRLLSLCVNGHYSLAEADQLLRSGALDTRQGKAVWLREVMATIETTWGDQWRRFELVISCGGGARLLERELVSRFGAQVWLSDDPVISTARGLYKFGLQKGL